MEGVEEICAPQVCLLATFSRALKAKNRALKTLLSVATSDGASGAGGAAASVSNSAFAAMAADPASRATFIDAAVALARANGFDGLDVTWWFPASAVDHPSEAVARNLDWVNVMAFGLQPANNVTHRSSPWGRSRAGATQPASCPTPRAVMTAYDNASVSSYVLVGDVWVAFDSVAVVAEKLDFVTRRSLLGYILWTSARVTPMNNSNIEGH